VAAEVPEKEPTSVQAGDTLAWTKDLADYPADEWDLSYSARGALPSQTLIDITATEDDTTFELLVSSATTAQWVSGRYTLVGYVSNGIERYEVYRGTFEVRENISDIGEGESFDGRSDAERMLQKVNLAYEDALRAVGEYGYNGTDTKLQLEALSKERDKLKAEVAQEQARGKNRRILTRFRNP